MKYLSLLIIILSQLSLFAIEMSVEYTPKRPRAGESFQITYVISGEDFEDFQDVEFEPVNFEILGKDSRSSSTRTTYINGKLSTSRTQRITYDVFATEETRKAIIKNLSLVMKNEKIEYADITIDLQAAIKSRDVFVKAEVDKTDLYLGEGTKVTYYLYSKTDASGVELRKFPVLKGFLKRFGQNKFYTEKREIDGEIFNRTYLYSAYIFPQNTGELTVDSLTVSARIASQRRRRETFDVFGFSFGSQGNRVRKVMRSQPVKINVKPLPTPKPNDFTGLVGNHEFQFSINKSRFLANEPIEIKLTVSGEGELESFEAPKLFDEKKFERFDSDGRLSTADSLVSRKEFTYTYLAKISGSYPARTLNFKTFNPVDKKFENHQIQIPEMKVAAGVTSNNQGKFVGGDSGTSSGILSGFGDGSGQKNNQDGALNINDETGIQAPIFEYESLWADWKIKLMRLLVIIVLISTVLVYIQTKEKKELKGIDKYAHKLKSTRWKYSDLYMFLDYLRSPNDDKSILATVETSSLSKEAKKHFLNLLEQSNENEFFSQKKSKKQVRVLPQYINEVIKKSEEYGEHLS